MFLDEAKTLKYGDIIWVTKIDYHTESHYKPMSIVETKVTAIENLNDDEYHANETTQYPSDFVVHVDSKLNEVSPYYFFHTKDRITQNNTIFSSQSEALTYCNIRNTKEKEKVIIALHAEISDLNEKIVERYEEIDLLSAP